MKFDYHLPVNLHFGAGCIKEVGNLTAKYGKKALVVTGQNSTKKTGLLDKVCTYLKQVDVDVVIYDQVRQNPLTTTALEGVQLAKEQNCDVIVGIGGGSIMDCAKAIAFLCANEGDINDYIFKRLESDKALPIILVPTTCGTGSEGNGFAVLTNPENGDKKSLRCNSIVAKASIIDSDLMRTMPKHIFASVAFDALCHCMEASVSKLAQPITKALCIEGMTQIGRYLVPIYEGEESKEAWDQMAFASTIGGMVINNAGVVLPHGMEHPASGLKNLVHGQGLAALTPVITDFSVARKAKGYEEISKCLGGQKASQVGDLIRKLLEQIHLNVSLGELGIGNEDIPWMTKNCLKVSAANIVNHPVRVNEQDIFKLYEQALAQ